MAKLGLRDHKYDEFSAATAIDLLKMEVEMCSSSPNKTVSFLRKSSSFEKNSNTLLKKKTRRGLIVVSVTLSIFAFLSWYYITQHGRMSIRQIGHARFNPTGRELKISNHDEETILAIELGMFLPVDVYPMECEEFARKDVICIDWVKNSQENELLATMEITSTFEAAIITVQIEWHSQRLDAPLQDCVLMGDHHWYGGGLVTPIKYPIEVMDIPMQPFISRDFDPLDDFKTNDQLFGPTERLWFSSAGLAINVHEDVPLQISSNENKSQKLCFKSEVLDSPFQNPLHDFPMLLYTIFISHNISDIRIFTAKEILMTPTHIPSSEIFSTPIWLMNPSPNISGQTLIDFALSLNQHGFQVGEIQTGWTDDFGSSKTRVDILSLLNDASQDDLRVISGYNWTIATSPYIDITSENFHFLISSGYLITDSGGEGPALVKWKGSYAGILDVTNREATDWCYRNLQDFRRRASILNHFVFDGGYGANMPHSYGSTIPFDDPSSFCTYYTEFGEKLGKSGRRKCTQRSQESPLFLQLDPWQPHWHESGLQGIIPTILQYSLVGYPFVIPPTVCGIIESGSEIHHPTLDKELYVRWLQLMTYLPVMTFCAMPWEFGKEVVEHTKEMINIHREQISPMMDKWALEALKTGEPIIRPVWWNAPKDDDALTIDNEFLIGDEILVAPVLEKGARVRDVYLPRGRWMDNLKKTLIIGGAWLIDYNVGLWEVATFTRQE